MYCKMYAVLTKQQEAVLKRVRILQLLCFTVLFLSIQDTDFFLCCVLLIYIIRHQYDTSTSISAVNNVPSLSLIFQA